MQLPVKSPSDTQCMSLCRGAYLKLVTSQRVEQQVDTLAACDILDCGLKAECARVSNVILLQPWEGPQQELPLLGCAHSDKDLSTTQGLAYCQKYWPERKRSLSNKKELESFCF